MTLILSGTDGLSDIDGSAATPAIRGTDANTGIFFPAADTIAFSEGGAEVARFDSSGNLLVGTTSAATPSTTGYISVANTFGFKNRIINGAMVIDQRSAGASTSVQTSTVYPSCDRWTVFASQNSKFSIQQNAGAVTPPVGFSNYLGITSSSAYSIVAGDYFGVYQRIEGFNTSDLAFGTASASTITLSFWVRSSLTGTFGGALNNSGNSRSYPFTYTISSANTWEQKSVTVAGDTSGTWVGGTNGSGLQVTFGIGSGSTFSGTAGAWASANYSNATGAISVVGTSGATFYITGVQLEKGSTATSFDYRPYGTELSLCQRYCPAWSVSGVSTNYPFAGQCYLTTAAIFTAPYPVQPRVAATGITTSGTFAVVPANYGTSAAGTVAIYGTGTNLSTFALNVTASSGLVAGNSTSLQSSSATSLIIGTGCEL